MLASLAREVSGDTRPAPGVESLGGRERSSTNGQRGVIELKPMSKGKAPSKIRLTGFSDGRKLVA